MHVLRKWQKDVLKAPFICFSNNLFENSFELTETYQGIIKENFNDVLFYYELDQDNFWGEI